MIEANELRIGNWVLDTDWRGGAKNTIIKLSADDFYEEIGSGNCFDRYEPIPLSPEILEKADINQMKKVSSLIGIIETQPTVELKKHQDKYTATSTYYWGLEILSTEVRIKYVHQLQNLYFALTGEELTIEDFEPKGRITI